MKSAQEVLKVRKEMRQAKMQEKIERINLELLEVEKGINKFENNLEDNDKFITIPLIIKTDEVKSLLEQNGYIIDKVSNDIEVNTTRLWLDKEDYDKQVLGNKKLRNENCNIKSEKVQAPKSDSMTNANSIINKNLKREFGREINLEDIQTLECLKAILGV